MILTVLIAVIGALCLLAAAFVVVVGLREGLRIGEEDLASFLRYRANRRERRAAVR